MIGWTTLTNCLVFRIEKCKPNYEGGRHIGPYVGGAIFFGPSHNDPRTHPSPFADRALDPEQGDPDYGGRVLGITPDEICGLDSLRSVQRWFNGHGIALSDAGYWITAYSVDDQFIRQGRKQLVFSQRHATALHKMDPALFIKEKEND